MVFVRTVCVYALLSLEVLLVPSGPANKIAGKEALVLTTEHVFAMHIGARTVVANIKNVNRRTCMVQVIAETSPPNLMQALLAVCLGVSLIAIGTENAPKTAACVIRVGLAAHVKFRLVLLTVDLMACVQMVRAFAEQALSERVVNGLTLCLRKRRYHAASTRVHPFNVLTRPVASRKGRVHSISIHSMPAARLLHGLHQPTNRQLLLL
jgi:hypothetical protein